eukprot:symbB.v1.2.032532.t1/scaffold3911.1/size48435/3
MGCGLCSRCSELKKVDLKSAGIRPEDLEDEVNPVGSEDDRSEADLQSEVGDTAEDLKEGIQKLLEETGRTLERGQTLALKEAITAAKKNRVRNDLIKEAERRLEHHQLGQKRQESEVKVSKWLQKDSRDLEECERLLEEAVRNQCDEQMQKTLQKRLAELKITRPLESEEAAQAKEYVVESCRDFVSQASQKGRPSLFLNLDEGNKCTATMYLNPPLQVLSVKVEDGDDGSLQQNYQEPICFAAFLPLNRHETGLQFGKTSHAKKQRENHVESIESLSTKRGFSTVIIM